MRLLYRSPTAQGGAVLLLSALIVLIGVSLFLAFSAELMPMQAWVLLILLLLVTIFVGYRKITEPCFSVELDPTGLTYHHRSGSWFIPWHRLSLAVVPQLSNGQSTGMIGFRLTHYSEFIQQIPARLAVRLVIEQRNVLVMAIRENCPDGTCPSALLTEIGDILLEKTQFKGVQAMFARRMQNFRQLLAVDLLIPIQTIPTEPMEFCKTVNQWRLRHLSKHAE